MREQGRRCGGVFAGTRGKKSPQYVNLGEGVLTQQCLLESSFFSYAGGTEFSALFLWAESSQKLTVNVIYCLKERVKRFSSSSSSSSPPLPSPPALSWPGWCRHVRVRNHYLIFPRVNFRGRNTIIPGLVQTFRALTGYPWFTLEGTFSAEGRSHPCSGREKWWCTT